jgi:nuclear RNA export factor
MLIKVRPGLPHVELDYTMKEKIKAAMVKRYNANLKALDLSRFHTDPGEGIVICILNTQLIN